jgi:hypothetical protein
MKTEPVKVERLIISYKEERGKHLT